MGKKKKKNKFYNYRAKKLDDNFAENLSKLESIEFLGLCHFCKIDIFDEDGEPRDFYDLLDELIGIFGALDNKNKKKIIKLMTGK